MKYLRQLSITLVLLFVLAGAARADDGVIHPWWTDTNPTPSSTDPTIQATTSSATTTTDVATEAALSLAQSVASLL
jgi:hypothetical protein